MTDKQQSAKAGFIKMTASRSIYIGSLGRPGMRCLGSLTVYAALGQPLEIVFGDGQGRPVDTVTRHVVVVPPYLQHKVTMNNPYFEGMGYMLEPETISAAGMSNLLRLHTSKRQVAALLGNVRRLYSSLPARGFANGLDDRVTDEQVLGYAVENKAIDERVQKVIHNISKDPGQPWSAQSCASQACLSESRFLHLFKSEAGISFRQLRLWRRAREFMDNATGNETFTDIAIRLGYPDATHFCHSMKRIYGMSPRDIRAAMSGRIYRSAIPA